MSKYVIKNCPAFNYDCMLSCKSSCTDEKYCHKCTDCVMKKIVELCKSKKESSYTFAVAFFADTILKLLNIEECE